MARTDKAQYEIRVGKVLRLVLSGVSSGDILRIVSQAETGEFAWGVKRRTVQRYIREARARIKQSSNVDRRELIGLAISRYEDLYLRLYEKRDFRGCARITREITDLFGLSHREEVLDRLVALERKLTKE